MMTLAISEARGRLSELLDLVAKGHTILVTRLLFEQAEVPAQGERLASGAA